MTNRQTDGQTQTQT